MGRRGGGKQKASAQQHREHCCSLSSSSLTVRSLIIVKAYEQSGQRTQEVQSAGSARDRGPEIRTSPFSIQHPLPLPTFSAPIHTSTSASSSTPSQACTCWRITCRQDNFCSFALFRNSSQKISLSQISMVKIMVAVSTHPTV